VSALNVIPLLVAGQVLTPPTDVDPPVVSPGFTQLAPAVAAGTATYLVVYSDQPRGGTYFARVASGGTVLDVTGVPIGLASFGIVSEVGRAALFDGTRYAIAWNDDLGAGSGIVTLLRVAEDGGWLDSAPLELGTGGDRVTLAHDASLDLAVWDTLGTTLQGVRVPLAGAALDSPPLVLATADAGTLSWPHLASDGTQFLLVFENDFGDGGSAVLDELVSDQGAVTAGPNVLVPGPFAQGPAVGFGQDHYLLAWFDADAGLIRAGRLDLDGGWLGTAGTALSGPGMQQAPEVTCDGTDCVVLWADPAARLEVAVVDGTGTVLFQGSGGGTSNPAGPGAACGAMGCLVAWSSAASGSVSWAPLSVVSEWTGDGGQPAAQIENGQLSPNAAANRAGAWTLGWTDNRSASDVLYVGVTAPGVVADVFPLSSDVTTEVINTLNGVQTAFSPAIASDGSDFLFAWSNYSVQLVAQRMSSDGGLLDPGEVPIAAAPGLHYNVAATYGMGQYFLSWMDAPGYVQASLYGARVTPQGVVLDDGGFSLVPSTARPTLSCVATGASTHLICWAGGNPVGAYVTRVLSDGGVVDPSGLALPSNGLGELLPSADFDGQFYWTAWSQQAVDGSEDVYGARVDEDGGLIDTVAVPINTHAGDQEYPVVACQPESCVVMWIDTRNGREDLYAAWLSRDGGVSPADGLPLAVEPVDKWNPALVTDRQGTWLVTYQEYEAAPLDNYRVRARWFSTVPDGGEGPPDAGPLDAGATDAGELDAGAQDAGPSSSPDGGGGDAGPAMGRGSGPQLGVGCGCAHGPGIGDLAALLGIIQALTRSRRFTRRVKQGRSPVPLRSRCGWLPPNERGKRCPTQRN
jgi:hypothetical protein